MTRLALLRHLAFCGALAALSAAVVQGMILVRIMDHPESRKAHGLATPKAGGVGIVVAFLVGIALLYRFASFSRIANGYFIGLIAASAAIALVALLDDLRDWPFSVKLGAQIAAAMAALGTGLFIQVYRIPYVGAVEIGWWGLAPTLFWILFATNALNFIDGLDGLAAGVVLIACAFLAVIGASQGSWFLYFAALLLASGALGFLPFNFPRARIFMGDVGSQFCGFVLAVLAIAAGRFERVPMSFVLVPVLLSGVLYDVGFTLVRRFLAGQKLTSAHRGHLYQVAHRAGARPAQITLIHWSFVLVNGACCLAFIHATSTYKPLILGLPVLPQLAWTAWVRRIARKARVGAW